MHDDRIFDLADFDPFKAAFEFGEHAWITTPEPWRRAVLSDDRNHRVVIARGPTQVYAVTALECLAASAGRADRDAVPFSAVVDEAERKYAAFLAERARLRKIGPLFSPLETFWLIALRDHTGLRNPVDADFYVDLFAVADNNPLHGRVLLDCLDQGEIAEGAIADMVHRAGAALVNRYLDAQAMVLRQIADEAMAEASAPAPQRARRRL